MPLPNRNAMTFISIIRVVGMFLSLSLCLSVTAQSPEQLQDAKTLIVENRHVVFSMMHPTGELTRTTYVGYRREGEGFFLTYSFTFDGLLGVHTSTMDFVFDTYGQFVSLRTRSTNCPVAPFAAGDFAADLVKDLIKDFAEIEDDGLIAKALESANFKKAAELFLRQAQTSPGASPPSAPETTPPRGGRPSATDPELLDLISKTESMDDEERAYWRETLPKITPDQRARLKEILVTEKRKLDELERKYQEEMRRLDEKHKREGTPAGDSSLINLIKTSPVLGESLRKQLLDGELARMTPEEREALRRLLMKHSQRRDDARDRARAAEATTFTRDRFQRLLDDTPSLTPAVRTQWLDEWDAMPLERQHLLRIELNAEQEKVKALQTPEGRKALIQRLRASAGR